MITRQPTQEEKDSKLFKAIETALLQFRTRRNDSLTIYLIDVFNNYDKVYTIAGKDILVDGVIIQPEEIIAILKGEHVS